MELDPVILSRIQFGFVVSFHAVFPVFTIGLASYVALLHGLYYKTGNAAWDRLAAFWVKVFAVVFAYLVQPTCSWEEVLAVLMEGDRHASVAEVEGLLYSISVVDVDVQVEHSGVDLQKLEDGQHNVVDVAKA